MATTKKGSSASGKEEEISSEKSSPPRYGRRILFRKAKNRIVEGVAIGLTTKTVGEMATDIIVDHAINDRAPIPLSLQHSTIVDDDTEIIGIGAGDSSMAGQGAKKPLIKRVEKHVRDRGIKMTTISVAENGSTTDDLPRQAQEAKRQLPPSSGKTRVDVHIESGANDIKNNRRLTGALKRIGRNLFDTRALRVFREERENVRGDMRRKTRERARETANTVEAGHITLYGIPPIQYAPAINEIDEKTGKVSRFPIKEQSIGGAINQMIIADLGREANKGIGDAGVDLQREGRSVNMIDTAENIPASSYTNGDQHFDRVGAESLAKASAKKYNRGKRQTS